MLAVPRPAADCRPAIPLLVFVLDRAPLTVGSLSSADAHGIGPATPASESD
jgi:hypothetical protein